MTRNASLVNKNSTVEASVKGFLVANHTREELGIVSKDVWLVQGAIQRSVDFRKELETLGDLNP